MNKIIGVESWNAVCTAIDALVAPGPRVTKQMPGVPVSLPYAFGHVGGAAVLAGDDQADVVARVVERVEHREIALAGHAEREVGAVNAELVDQDLPAGARGGGHGR